MQIISKTVGNEISSGYEYYQPLWCHLTSKESKTLCNWGWRDRRLRAAYDKKACLRVREKQKSTKYLAQ